jgi:hypothetical protein
MFNFGFYRNNKESVQKAIIKLEKNELLLEDILDDEEIVSEVKNNPQCKLGNL